MNEQPHPSRSGISGWFAVLLGCCAAVGPAFPRPADAAEAPKIAVFDFELQDDSASAAPSGERAADAAVLREVSDRVRKTLANSGKYTLVDTGGAEARVAKARPLRKCDGCDADLARELGADLSLLGVIVKAGQIDYAVEIQVREAATGKVVFARRGVFLGGATEWSSGASSLVRRELLQASAERSQPRPGESPAAPRLDE